MKTCSSCQTAKPNYEFHKNKGGKDGLQASCKTCCIHRTRKWQTDNNERHLHNRRTYEANRAQEDTLFQLTKKIRSLIAHYLSSNGHTKKRKTEIILGCSFEELQSHLIETAFKRYGFYLYDQDYHIDHIIPVSSATTEAELLTRNHYTNLQFLYPKDNLKKGAK